MLRLRFGFDGEKERSLQEFGDVLGISHEKSATTLKPGFQQVKAERQSSMHYKRINNRKGPGLPFVCTWVGTHVVSH